MNCIQPSYTTTMYGSTLGTAEPHYIPGYLGYVPQEKYRPGHTFGVTTHRILLDPCIHMSPRSLLTNMRPGHCADDFGRPGLGADPFLPSQMALVNTRVNSFGRQQYQPNMTPGYTGYVPKLQTILGHSYSPACNRALARFEQDQWRDRLFNKELEALDGWRFCYKTKPWESPEVIRPAATDLQEFANPTCGVNDTMRITLPVGGGCCNSCSTGGGGSTSAPAPGGGCCGSSSIRSTSIPVSGGGGCASCSGSGVKFGTPSTSSSCGPRPPMRILSPSNPKCDYSARREWGIATDHILHQTCGGNTFKINTQKFVKPVDRVQVLYKDCEGMLPNYNGHVPGEQFRIGRTYGSATRNARRVLEQPTHAPYCFPLRRDE